MTKGYGNTKNGISIMTTILPGTKKPSLCILEQGGITKVATFISNEHAKVFFEAFAEVAGFDKIDWSDKDDN